MQCPDCGANLWGRKRECSRCGWGTLPGLDAGAARREAGGAAPDLQEPAGPTATVELLRVWQLLGVGTAVAVYVDGSEVGRIKGGQLAICTVEPGLHYILVQDRGCPPLLWSSPLLFDAAEGSRTCFECGFDWIGRPWLKARER